MIFAPASVTRLICSECGEGHLRACCRECDMATCTNGECLIEYRISTDIAPYAEGTALDMDESGLLVAREVATD